MSKCDGYKSDHQGRRPSNTCPLGTEFCTDLQGGTLILVFLDTLSWTIDRVMVGDSRRGKRGNKMQNGVLYAAIWLTGGDESFLPIDSNSIILSLHTMQALL